MMKTIFALGALTLATAASAQTTPPPATGDVPMCSATVHDSCQQGPNNPRAMTAEQAMASGGVGDRKTDKADYMAPANPGHAAMHKKVVHKRTMKHNNPETTTTSETTTVKQ